MFSIHSGFSIKGVVALTAAALLAGCVSTRGIAPTAQPVSAQELGLTTTAAPQLLIDWWNALNDRALTDMIERAVADNPSLRVARYRIERAQAAIAVAEANGGVQIGGDASATRQKFSANSIYPPPLGGSTQTIANAQVGASWEFDFFGRNRAAIDAALGTRRAAEADAEAARNVLATQVARQYVQLARLIELRNVAVRTLKQRDQTLSLISQRVQSGLDTNVELRQGEGAVPEARRQIEQLDEQITLARNALAALTVQPAATFATLSPALPALSTSSLVVIPDNVPADLIGRRADIAAARARIEAATGEIAGAKAQFYPNINLTAFIGLASIGLNQLLKTDSIQWGVGPAIHLPIFDAGRLRANLRGKTADLDVAVETYNSAVIDAIHDVADQLASVRSIELQQREEAATLAAAESAYDLALQRFRAGLATYLSVLTTESTVLNERRQDAELKARALDVRLALVRALGGGYLAPMDPAPLAARGG
ncbi:MAG: efflux transporter outer membrane subunit [Betaproteobacteria bacterium]